MWAGGGQQHQRLVCHQVWQAGLVYLIAQSSSGVPSLGAQAQVPALQEEEERGAAAGAVVRGFGRQ